MPTGELKPEANPNGSARHIAGIFNESKNVLGLMPHPENAVEDLHGSTDGRAMFKGIVEGALIVNKPLAAGAGDRPAD